MSFPNTHSPVAQTTGAKRTRRYVFWTLSILLLTFACFVALMRLDILPPTQVLSYQFGLSPKPSLGDSRIDLRGWAWYPILVEEKTATRPQQVTFVPFSPFHDPAMHPITVFYRVEKFSDEYFLMERQFSWGAAKFFKPGVIPGKQIHFAWLPDHKFVVAAQNAAELQEALLVLEIKNAL